MEKIRRKILIRLNQAKSCETALNALSTDADDIKDIHKYLMKKKHNVNQNT